MTQCQLKLKLSNRQERQLDRWLWHLSGVRNWATRKIQQDATNGVYHSAFDVCSLVVSHGAKIGIPQHVVEATAVDSHAAWSRCFKRLQIFYRAARNSNWIRADGTVRKQAFNRSPPPYDREGLSGSPYEEHCQDGLPLHARDKGIITILVGHVRALHLTVEPDTPTHGNIKGMPDRDDDPKEHDRFANKLAEKARSIR